ncbi:MAG: hypothetical protein EXR53_02950 [Dehalococcoidia bacterium]|nr:hypothetical protein [Dehalococcoidia bacterium]
MDSTTVTASPPPQMRNIWRWAVEGRTSRGLPPLLLALLVIALALRLYGINWDQGNFFHPDERSIYMRVDCMYRLLTEAQGYQECTRDAPFQRVVAGFPSPPVFLNAAKSPLNPHWFPLGSIIIYVLLAIKLALAPLLSMDLQDLAIAGRSLSALADAGTVALVYALGRRLYGRGAGLLAAALVAFAVVHIQHSHYYRPETFTNLFVLASFWFMLQVVERQRLRDSLMLGLFVGLAFATKVSVLPLLLPLAAVYGRLLWLAWGGTSGGNSADQAERVILRALAAGAVAAATYLFWTPYALLDFPEFLEWNLRELDVVRHAGIVPYTVQYIEAPRFLYEIRQTTMWGLGLPLGLMAWGGLLATAALNLRRPRLGQVLLLLWAVPLLLTVGSVEVKFLRYTFPLVPPLILMGAGAAWDGMRWLENRHKALGMAAAVAIGLVMVFTAFYALAFQTIYTRPHTAVQASQWLNANVPYTALILTDNHWDEGIPDLGRYRVTQLPMFEGDTPQKMGFVASNLASTDYLVFYSNRTYGAIARVPERYPFSSNYYRLLFSGDLGYELANSFDSYPRLLGVAFVDDPFGRAGLPVPKPLAAQSPAPLSLNLGYADNDAITYDRPLVMVFKNTARYDANRLAALLLKPTVTVEPKLALVLTAEEQAVQQQGGTWSDLFDNDSLANRFPVLVWLLLVEAASLATLPLGFVVFRGLSDRGYILTKTLAVLLLAYIPWLLAAVKLMDFGRLSIYLALLALALASAIVLALRRRDIVAYLRGHWRILALEESLFLVAFLAFVAVRWANPDLWHPYRGGEKPMDLAYLMAMVRSTTIPPYDPWFAGGYLNYYYFGQFIVATLIKATGILPEVAYNLAVPLLFALTAGGAFSVVYNLTSAMRQRSERRLGPGWGPAAAGVVALFMVAVLGNLGDAVQLVRTAWSNVASSPAPEGDPFHVWFWFTSRMMPGQISITEFPLWTFLFADLHAHLIAMPFALLAVGLALNLVLAAEQRDFRWRALAAPLAALTLAVGALAAINTWDYPTYLLLALAAVFLAAFAVRRRVDARLLAPAALGMALVAGLSYIAFLPYHQHYIAFNVGVHSSGEQTSLPSYLAVHGLFLFLIVSYLVYEAAGPMRAAFWPRRSSDVPSLGLVSQARGTLLDSPLLPVALPAAGALVAYTAAAGYVTVALLFVVMLVPVLLGVRHLVEGGDKAPYHLFLLVLVVGAFGLGMAVDMVTLNNDIDRMNTVFKLYLEAWVLYSVASATILWYLVASGRNSIRRLLWAKSLWLLLLLVLVAGVSVFPVMGTRVRLAERFSSAFTGLNGARYMENGVYFDEHGPINLHWDWAAIQWLRDNVKGSPVIAEGNTAPHNYRWGSRVSIYTGLPTIVGWGWHQTQQRAGEEWAVQRRLDDLAVLYNTTDVGRAESILRNYGIKYVYVGEVERLYYSAEGLAKFPCMADSGLTLVYTNLDVDIYQVDLAPES